MKKNNSGFSLIELIVVISVMVIITAVGGSWIVRLSGYRVRECTSKITNGLTQAKVLCMSKSVNTGDVYWLLEKNAADGQYYGTTYVTKTVGGAVTVESEDRTKLGKGSIIVKFIDASGSQEVSDSHNYLAVAYKRNTGEMYMYNGNFIPHNNPMGYSDWRSCFSKSEITKIEVTNGSKSYEINITPKTGKINGRN